MKFKVLFPGGYRVEEITNDNIDVNVILPDGKVYFGTLFTVDNVKYLIEKEGQNYFWATDRVIVSDLKERTIYQIIEKIVNNEDLPTLFCEIGTLPEVHKKYKSFNDIPFWYPKALSQCKRLKRLAEAIPLTL